MIIEIIIWEQMTNIKEMKDKYKKVLLEKIILNRSHMFFINKIIIQIEWEALLKAHINILKSISVQSWWYGIDGLS